jgi:hypothetical protein
MVMGKKKKKMHLPRNWNAVAGFHRTSAGAMGHDKQQTERESCREFDQREALEEAQQEESDGNEDSTSIEDGGEGLPDWPHFYPDDFEGDD